MPRISSQKRDNTFVILLKWYRKHGRDLPWRKTKDPYRILVSEVMLQQTQVARVIEYYNRWMKRFPTWESLAEAKTSDLIHAWAGLGYNRRALYLRAAARIVIKDDVPRSIEEWKRLPGVGPYTAAAVFAFSNHKGALAIDTNVRRVAGRITLGLPYPTHKHDGRIEKALSPAFKDPKSWENLHAFMDLGAMICHVDKPDCDVCPMREVCKARTKFNSGKTLKKTIQKTKERIEEGKQFPDRIYRGRILKLIRENDSYRIDKIGEKIDARFDSSTDTSWIERMVHRLERDGLIQRRGKKILLPD